MKYILVAKLIFGWWAFGPIPGVSLSSSASIFSTVCNDPSYFSAEIQDVASETFAPDSAEATAFSFLAGICYVSERLETSGSLFMFLGAVAAFLLLFVQCILGRLPSFMFALCNCSLIGCNTTAPEVDYNPPFMECVGGVYAEIPGVKRRKNGTLVLKSDVISEETWCTCLAKCKLMGLHSFMLYISGIEVTRSRVTMKEYNEMPNKKGTISGKPNTTYAPFFQPRYVKAFQFADKEDEEAVSPARDLPAPKEEAEVEIVQKL